ncbi:MAG: hypothetical protein RIC19_24800 [Phaeodactylibacter sp.]|uniref:hypothetical protein n=1 Tax=Phaeodactylibacter sp. TaxID=1940289 RepID=UPI0032ED563D
MIISQWRNRLFFRLLTAFLGLVFLDGIVDPPDMYSDVVAEDLSYNEMESVLELFVECVLQYEDFFQEYDDDDAGKTLLKKRSSLDVFLFPALMPVSPGPRSGLHRCAQTQLEDPKDIWLTPQTPPPDFPA